MKVDKLVATLACCTPDQARAIHVALASWLEKLEDTASEGEVVVMDEIRDVVASLDATRATTAS